MYSLRQIVVQLPENCCKHEVGENYINPYEKVEIFWPVELCRNGVEVIDSPGLNEHTTREQITMDYLSIVDAV